MKDFIGSVVTGVILVTLALAGCFLVDVKHIRSEKLLQEQILKIDKPTPEVVRRIDWRTEKYTNFLGEGAKIEMRVTSTDYEDCVFLLVQGETSVPIRTNSIVKGGSFRSYFPGSVMHVTNWVEGFRVMTVPGGNFTNETGYLRMISP